MKKILVVVFALALFFQPLTAFSRTLDSVEMPETVDVDGKALQLQGMGSHKNSLGTVYVAGFYLPAPARSAEEALKADVPKRLHLKFVRTMELSDLRRTIRNGFKENIPDPDPELAAKITSLLEAFNAESDPRTSLVITYTPGGGTTVEKIYVLSGTKTIGWFGGWDFMYALFSVWLGNVPAAPEVKAGMIGN